MNANAKPVSIKKIEITYQDGTRLVVKEAKTPLIGKLFFDSVKANEEIEWEIVESGSWVGNRIKRLLHWFNL